MRNTTENAMKNMTKKAMKHKEKQIIELPVKYVDKDGTIKSVTTQVEGIWDEGCNDWLLTGDALRKLDEVKARHMFDECKNCETCELGNCLLIGKNKKRRWGSKAK